MIKTRLLGVMLLLLCALVIPSCSNNTQADNSAKECKSTDDYKNGYKAGHNQVVIGGSTDYDTYLNSQNNGNGTIGTVSDCWRQGFYDGTMEK